MNYLQAIERRYSKRRYQKKTIEADLILKLKALIKEYNEKSGLSIQLRLNEPEAFQGFRVSYGMFSGVRHYIALIGKTNDPHRMEKEGYYGERIVLAATEMGLSTCWIGTSYDEKKCQCDVADDEILDLVIAIGYGEERQTFREKLITNQIHRNTKPAEALMETAGDVLDWFKRGMDAVSKAPTARNQFPFVFTCADGRVNVKTLGDSERVMVDLGIAKLHFELGAGNGRFPFGDNAAFIRD